MQFWTKERRADAKSVRQEADERFIRIQKRLLFSDDIGRAAGALLRENTDNPACCRTCLTCKKVCRTTKDWIRHEGTPECLKRRCENEGREYVPPPPPKCEYCEKEFKNKYCLKKHMGTASHKRVMNIILNGPEAHRCDKCDKIFRSKNNLVRHLKTKRHLAPKEDLFCCDKTFKNLKCLRQHKKSNAHLYVEKVIAETAFCCSKTALAKGI